MLPKITPPFLSNNILINNPCSSFPHPLSLSPTQDEIQEFANSRLGSYVNGPNEQTEEYVRMASVNAQFPALLKEVVGLQDEREPGDVEMQRRHDRPFKPKYETSLEKISTSVQRQLKLILDKDESVKSLRAVNKEALGFKLVLEEITALDKRLRPAGKKEKGTLLKDVIVGCEELEKTIGGLNEAVVVGRGKKDGRGANGSWVKPDWEERHAALSTQLQDVLQAEKRTRTRAGRRVALANNRSTAV